MLKFFFFVANVVALSSIATSAAKFSNFTALEDTAAAFQDSLTSRGYSVRRGSLKFIFKEDCETYVNISGSCYGNNPGTPYGLYQLPHIPGEAIEDLTEAAGTGGLGLEIRLRSNEAIVLMGVTPPKAQYFGYTSYLFKTLDRRGDGNFTSIFASLDDTLNPQSIRVGQRRLPPLSRLTPGAYDAAFEKDVIITTTGDKDTVRDIDIALNRAGVPKNIRNLQKISTTYGGILPPVGLFDAGLEADKDTLLFLHRVAIFDDEEAQNNYLNNPPVVIFRITPDECKAEGSKRREDNCLVSESSNRPVTSINDRFPIPIRARRNSKSENKYRNALDGLEAAVRAAHNVLAEVEVEQFPLNGNLCILGFLQCLGDNSDTVYFVSRPEFAFPDDDSYYIIIGVNHMATGSSKYSEVGSLDFSSLTGVASFNSVNDMPGSSSIYDGVDKSEYLYALTVRRNCNGIQFCMEIPAPPEYPKIDLNDPPIFTFRAVKSPRGQTGPDMDSLLLDRVFFARV